MSDGGSEAAVAAASSTSAAAASTAAVEGSSPVIGKSGKFSDNRCDVGEFLRVKSGVSQTDATSPSSRTPPTSQAYSTASPPVDLTPQHDESSPVQKNECDCEGECSCPRKQESCSRPGIPSVVNHSHARWLMTLGKIAGIAVGEGSVKSFFSPNVRVYPFFIAGIDYAITILFGVLSIILTLLMLPLILIDSIHLHLVWIFCIKAAWAKFLPIYGNSTASPAKPEDKTRWSATPFRGANPISDFFFRLQVHIMSLFSLHTIASESTLSAFREHLGECPPDFPLGPQDACMYFPKTGSGFDLSMLFVLDKISYEEVCQGFRERWIQWEPKTRAVLHKRWGRHCWKVMNSKDFDLTKHMKRVRVDLAQTTIAEVASEFASEPMDPTLPQWSVWLLEPTVESAEIAEMPCVNLSPCRRPEATEEESLKLTDIQEKSYIFGKWNHLYSDGVGMMTSIVSRLGDEPVSTDKLPEQYRRVVPWWQVYIYYGYHSIRGSLTLLPYILHCMFSAPAPVAMCQPPNQTTVEPAPAKSGILHCSAPAVLHLNEINVIRRGLAAREKRIAKNYAKMISAEEIVKIYAPRKRATVNDVFCYALSATFSQLRDRNRLKEILKGFLGHEQKECTLDAEIQKQIESGERSEFFNLIIPMMCRTSVPTRMDNFTSLPAARIPMFDCYSEWRGTLHKSPVTLAPESRDAHVCDDNITEEKVIARQCDQIARDLASVKASIDLLKRQNARVSLFVASCALNMITSSEMFEKLVHLQLGKNQFSSTNVAAPPIESTFLHRTVHGLFFWPAVPPPCLAGAAIVSLGDRFQLLSSIDDNELKLLMRSAEEVHKEITGEELEQDPELQKRVRLQLIDIIPHLVIAEFRKLKYLFQTEAEQVIVPEALQSSESEASLGSSHSQ